MTEDPDHAPPLLPPLTDEQRIDWLRLIRSENVGPVTFRTLVNRCGGARAALDALPELAKRGGARSIRIANRIDAERELERAAAIGARIIAIGEPEYPRLLRLIDGPPPLLTIRGRGEVLRQDAVALVGSRNASALGRRFTRELAEEAGAAGYAVVSGLARGIDAAAHEASLATGTIAVLAGGIDRIYPPEHAQLFQTIIDKGAAISEMPLGWQAQARDFPRRNRLIAGASLAVVIVEAAERSGSLITARMALDQGRDVLAVPGSPLDPRAAGTNRLIKDGAGIITKASDIVDALRAVRLDTMPHTNAIQFRTADPVPFEEEPPQTDRMRLISALGPAPVDIDMLIRETGLSTAKVLVILLELEIAGRLERHPGNKISQI